MRLRIFGFSFEKRKMPPLIDPNAVFTSLEASPTLESPGSLRFGVTKIGVKVPSEDNSEDWWLGVLLKVRDSKRFSKLTQKDGKRVMTSELLSGDDSLAEANVFIANPHTGAGLYAHHHQSASLNNEFGKVFSKEFYRIRDCALEQIDGDETLIGKARKQARQKYFGHLWLENLVLQESFKQLVASMRQVKTARVRLATVSTSKKLFAGRTWKPESEAIEFKIPADALPAEVGESLQIALTQTEITKASVTGIDDKGRERTYAANSNPYVLEEFDYDDITKDFELDLDDWIESLKKTTLVSEMVKVAQRPSVWSLLKQM